ncbi:hypothetical protein [Streptosporangium carneum]|nr:hypothetical protein [Streptosporangium carneum]
MTQNKYVTSTCIANIQRNLNEQAIPQFKDLKTKVDATDVGFPGFGALGLPFAAKYSSTQDDVKKLVDDAVAALAAWVDALETVKKNWRDAEEASKVKYS